MGGRHLGQPDYTWGRSLVGPPSRRPEGRSGSREQAGCRGGEGAAPRAALAWARPRAERSDTCTRAELLARARRAAEDDARPRGPRGGAAGCAGFSARARLGGEERAWVGPTWRVWASRGHYSNIVLEIGTSLVLMF